MMRFRGGGVGHKSTKEATDFFKNDRDILDLPNAMAEDEEPICEQQGAQSHPEAEEVDENEEEDYGYSLPDSDESEDETEDVDVEQVSDGEVLDSDMEELGYSEL